MVREEVHDLAFARSFSHLRAYIHNQSIPDAEERTSTLLNAELLASKVCTERASTALASRPGKDDGNAWVVLPSETSTKSRLKINVSVDLDATIAGEDGSWEEEFVSRDEAVEGVVGIGEA